jgi:PPP4R2
MWWNTHCSYEIGLLDNKLPLNKHYRSTVKSWLLVCRFPWTKLKKLIACKLEEVINDFQKRAPIASGTVGGVNTENVAFEEMKTRLLNSVEKFSGYVQTKL